MNDTLTPEKTKHSERPDLKQPEKIHRLKKQIQNRTYPILNSDLNADTQQAQIIYETIAQKLSYLKPI